MKIESHYQRQKYNPSHVDRLLVQDITTVIIIEYRNTSRITYSYCKLLTECRMCSIKWCHYQWPRFQQHTNIWHPIFQKR